MDRTAQLLPADPSFVPWLAGFIDGEGCFAISCRRNRSGSPSYSPVIVVANTNHSVLTEVRERLGVGGVYELRRAVKRSDWRRSYQYQVSGDAALRVASMVVSHLRVKREAAATMLQFRSARGCNQYKQRPASLVEEQAALKRRLEQLNRGSYPDN